MQATAAPPWALILAGGDGTRLRTLTRLISGDARPKQFCRLLKGESLLERTQRRVGLVSRFDRQVVVVTRAHEPFYSGLVADLAPGRLVVQPANRGTAAGILYPLLRIAELAGDVPLAIFPSDHFIDDDLVFMNVVRGALRAAAACPGLVVLLGIEAGTAEPEYGWIEPAARPLPTDSEPVFLVRRFWEKPSPDLARKLFARECLWNSFVMVGHVGAFLDLIAAGVPALRQAFEPVRRAVGSAREATAAEQVYAGIPELNFSEQVLVPAAGRIGVARVKGVDWSDLGNPERVLATISRHGLPRLPIAQPA